MPVLTSSMQPDEALRAQWAELAGQLRERRAAAAAGGPERVRERHVARGKLLPRDRVTKLLDPGSPFLEIGALAAFDCYGGDIHGAGLIAGIGRVSGREVRRGAAHPAVPNSRDLFLSDEPPRGGRGGPRAHCPGGDQHCADTAARFRPVVRAASGRNGRIRESLGTHW